MLTGFRGKKSSSILKSVTTDVPRAKYQSSITIEIWEPAETSCSNIAVCLGAIESFEPRHNS